MGLVTTAGAVRCRFRKGDLVRVKAEDARVRWRKPHLRTPGYIYGLVGEVERDCQACSAHHRPPQSSVALDSTLSHQNQP